MSRIGPVARLPVLHTPGASEYLQTRETSKEKLLYEGWTTIPHVDLGSATSKKDPRRPPSHPRQTKAMISTYLKGEEVAFDRQIKSFSKRR